MRIVRMILFGVAAVEAFFALAFVFRWPIAEEIWPLAYTNDLAFIFVGSIFAAAAASFLWCAVTMDIGALVGIGLDTLFIFTPLTVYLIQTSDADDYAIRRFALAAAFTALVGVGIVLWSRRYPIRDTRPLPALVRWSFIVFVIALLYVGGSLVRKNLSILPWTITQDGAVIYGWMYLGAAAYFTYTLIRPVWHNAAGQLAGFLAYDLVLIIPFLQLLPDISDSRRLNLYIYIVVVVYSGLLASYYLFIHPNTRLIRVAQQPALVPEAG
ncbi:MAG: hypothetical protein OHK0046_10130 [Anaerolineae bacterium]